MKYRFKGVARALGACQVRAHWYFVLQSIKQPQGAQAQLVAHSTAKAIRAGNMMQNDRQNALLIGPSVRISPANLAICKDAARNGGEQTRRGDIEYFAAAALRYYPHAEKSLRRTHTRRRRQNSTQHAHQSGVTPNYAACGLAPPPSRLNNEKISSRESPELGAAMSSLNTASNSARLRSSTS